MPTPTPPGSEIMRDYTVDGEPLSGVWNPRKSDLRTWMAGIESGRRDLCTSLRTYYVNPSTGDNSNTGRSPGDAFETLGWAVFYAALYLDLGYYGIVIQLADGTYNEALVQVTFPVGAPVAGGPGSGCQIIGNRTTPGNVVFNGVIQAIGAGVQWYVSGIKFGSGGGLSGHASGWLRFGKCEFAASSTYHILCDHKGIVEAMEDYKILGGTPNWHVLTNTMGYFLNVGVLVTLSGTPAFPAAFAAALNNSFQSWASVSFSGSATGPRYYVSTLSHITTNGGGASFLPGNSAGTADGATFGLYS